MKVLIIPSWYPHPEDKINGSFFREQALVVGDYCDVKVLVVRFESGSGIFKSSSSFSCKIKKIFKYIFGNVKKEGLPPDEIFLRPQLSQYSASVVAFSRRDRYRKRVNAYIHAFNDLVSTGWKPELIHAHSAELAGLVALEIKSRYNIPYVITEHMPFSIFSYPKIIQDDIRRVFLLANTVLSLSYDKVRQLAMSNISVEPNIVYNLVDESIFDRLSDKYIPGSPLKIISIGAASYLKDHMTMLRALKMLKDRGVPFSLTLIGLGVWGDIYDDIINFVRENNLCNDVLVIDKVDRSEVCGYLSSHQIYLMTSVAEGFPVSVLEAMACGLFVVATRHGGTEDILTSEVGVIVEIKNYEKIADRLQDLYLGNIGYTPIDIREHVVSLCGKKAFSERLIAYYRNSVKEN